MEHKITLADARTELGMKQADLAAEARLSENTISNAERGKPVQRLTAMAILQALNVCRSRAEKPMLTLKELAIKIRGENRKNSNNK